MKIYSGNRLRIKCWSEEIDEIALLQAKNLTSLKDSFYHIALMPDVHAGYGMPIGGVVAMKSIILPNAVGKDIGCGVCALKTSLKNIGKNDLIIILQQIRNTIPLGPKHHKFAQSEELIPKFTFDNFENTIIYKEKTKLSKQLGTLGGGNHFIEIQKGSDGYIWIMIHSGSRNLGNQVAEHYDKIAINCNKKYSLNIPLEYRLCGLPVDSNEGKMYIQEMNYCVEFAFANRKKMMENIKNIFQKTFSNQIIFSDFINIAHNYASLEEHFGSKVWIHRKGATKADKGLIGIIPGSQGTSSFIVVGKGNVQSFKSCSHGAGRKLGRNQAIEKLDFKKEKEFLDSRGILHDIRSKKDLQEAPGAYKNINQVMENQKDLVDIILELKPLAVVK